VTNPDTVAWIGRGEFLFTDKVWTGIPMNVHSPARRRWPGRLVILAVVVVVLALAAATFVLSYSGVHAIIAQAGVSARLARIYPGLFDALFIVACVAAVVLRKWWALLYAWLVIILVVAVVGAANAVHAMNVTLPHRTTEGVVAAAPWVIVLLGFGLMLTVLRQSRASRLSQLPDAAAVAEPPAPRPTEPVPETPSILESLLGPEVPVAAFGEPAEFAESVKLVEPAEFAESVKLIEPAGEEPVAASAPVVDAAWPTEEDRPPTVPSDVVDKEAPPQPAPPVTVPGSVVDDDAPPFATAPFPAVPRLIRVRSTPTPPDGSDDE
jgi:uncharacterized protein DUF2637